MAQLLLSYLQRLKGLLPVRLRQRPWLVFFVIIVLFGFALASPSFANADQGIMKGVMDALIRFVAWLMLIVANLCIGLTVFFLRFFIAIASYNDYINVDVVQLGWIMVRDVANMFFVVALLVIAFGTILGLEEYEWKKNLVKLILAAILINFSNMIAQLIIDVAHVFTITFLNAISATAGGNLINMFKLSEITEMVGGKDPSGLDLEILAGAITAVLFAIMAAVAMGSYLFVMIVRVVVLWALIILSPMAFILGVLPKTKAYADRWWSEFGKNVIVAPVMVFFLWLSFATLGNGDIASQINNTIPESHRMETGKSVELLGEANKPASLSLSKVSTWENMANFLLAIAFMGIGLKVTQETGAYGSGAVSKAMDFGKKVATVATGYAAGRWLVGKAGEGAKGIGKGLAKGAYIATLENPVERVKNWGLRQIEGYRDWRAQGPRMVKTEKGVELAQGKELTDEEKKKWDVVEHEGKRYLTDKQGKMVTEVSYDLEKEDTRGGIQKWLNKRQEKLIRSKKLLAKVTKQKTEREELIDKRVTAIPKHLFQRFEGVAEEKGELKPGEERKSHLFDALDRIEGGQLAAEKMRSEGKTKEFQAIGRAAVLGNDRFKDGAWQTAAKGGKGATGKQVVEHEEKALRTEAEIKELMGTAKRKFYEGKGKQTLEGRVRAELKLKAEDAETKKMQEQKLADLTGAGLAKLNEELADVRRAVESGEITEDQGVEREKALHEEFEKKDVVARRVAAEKQAHTEGEKVETVEAKVGRVYAEGEKGRHELAEEAKLEIEKTTATEVVKRLESEAKLRLVRQKRASGEPLTPYEELLEEQAKTKTRADTLKSAEEERVNNSSSRLMAEATKADTEAQKLERQSNEITSVEAQSLRATATKKVNEAGTIAETFAKTKRQRLEERQNYLLRIAEAKNETERKIKQDELKIFDDQTDDLVNKYNKDENGGVLERKLKDEADELLNRADEIDDLKLTDEQKNKRKSLRDQATAIRSQSIGWEYGIAKAKAVKSQRLYRAKHNTVIDDSEQRTIWDFRGIETPSTAQTENIEELEKEFRSMTYNMFVSNVSGALNKMLDLREKAKEGEIENVDDVIDEETRGSLTALMKHGINKSWIDDMIISVSSDRKLKQKFKEKLGWDDMHFELKKINLLQTLMATGGDLDFAATHDVVGDVLDVAEVELGMNKKEVYEGISSGRFMTSDGRDLTDQVKKRMQAKRDNKGVAWDWDKRIGGRDGKQMAREMQKYIETIRNNQAQFQFMANLRDELVGTSHPENSGHATHADVGEGEKLFVPVGSLAAKLDVLGEKNKIESSQRVKEQSHSVAAKLSEKRMAMLQLDRQEYRVTRGNIKDVRAGQGTNTRLTNHLAGLSAREEASKFRNAEGQLVICGRNNETGENSDLHEDYQEEYADDYRRADTYDKRIGVSSSRYVRDVLIQGILENPQDMLMNLANRSGLDPSKAAQTGAMNIVLHNSKGDRIPIKNISNLIELYNRGEFSLDGRQPSIRVPHFIPSAETDSKTK